MPKRNNYYSEELYKEVNKENRMILEDFQLEMRSKGRSKGTISQYSFDIRMFFCWVYLFNNNKNVLEMKKREFRNFFLQISDAGTSAARINRIQCSLRNMLEFCSEDEDEYNYPINIMQKIKGVPKNDVREIFFLTDQQIDIILNELMEKEQYQKALYLSLSYDSAARRNEVHQVNKLGFLENKMTNEVIGKRGKRFKLLYFNRTREIAKLYFEQRGDDENASLWTITSEGTQKQISYDTLYSWCLSFRKILEDKTGELIDFTPHSFRHTALENYNNGTHHVLKELGKKELPLKVLKILAHHEDISTTQSYLVNKDDTLLNDAFGL